MYSKRQAGKAGWLFLIIPVLVIVIIAGIVIGGYNKAVRRDEAVTSNWAQVENQLTRRYDLIPNLMETVKGYAKHETELFKHVADARTKYFSAKGPAAKAQAASGLESVLSRLLVLKETYPDLKANQSFLKFQDELAGTENRIAVERMRYNNSVKVLNAYARSFFGRSFCSMAGVEKREYFEAPEEKKVVPKVQF